jgi:hypothetical protein
VTNFTTNMALLVPRMSADGVRHFYSKVFLLDTGDKRQNGWDTSRLLGTWLTQDSWE